MNEINYLREEREKKETSEKKTDVDLQRTLKAESLNNPIPPITFLNRNFDG